MRKYSGRTIYASGYVPGERITAKNFRDQCIPNGISEDGKMKFKEIETTILHDFFVAIVEQIKITSMSGKLQGTYQCVVSNDVDSLESDEILTMEKEQSKLGMILCMITII